MILLSRNKISHKDLILLNPRFISILFTTDKINMIKTNLGEDIREIGPWYMKISFQSGMIVGSVRILQVIPHDPPCFFLFVASFVF